MFRALREHAECVEGYSRLPYRLKVPTFIYTFIYISKWRSDHSLALGSVAQLAAAHCPNEQTLDPTVAA